LEYDSKEIQGVEKGQVKPLSVKAERIFLSTLKLHRIEPHLYEGNELERPPLFIPIFKFQD